MSKCREDGLEHKEAASVQFKAVSRRQVGGVICNLGEKVILKLGIGKNYHLESNPGDPECDFCPLFLVG